MFEGYLFIKGIIQLYRKGRKWRHEDASEMMLDYLVKDNGIEIGDRDLTFIKALIAGDPNRCRYVFHV